MEQSALARGARALCSDPRLSQMPERPLRHLTAQAIKPSAVRQVETRPRPKIKGHTPLCATAGHGDPKPVNFRTVTEIRFIPGPIGAWAPPSRQDKQQTGYVHRWLRTLDGPTHEAGGLPPVHNGERAGFSPVKPDARGAVRPPRRFMNTPIVIYTTAGPNLLCSTMNCLEIEAMTV